MAGSGYWCWIGLSSFVIISSASSHRLTAGLTACATQVVGVARAQEEVFPAVVVFPIVEGYFALTDNLEAISVYHDGGALIDSNPEQFRMHFNHGDQIVFAMALQKVLIDRDILDQT